MRYLVDLEKKEIVYDKEMPAGHMIALRKVFKDKGFTFIPKPSIETMDEFNEKMKEEITRHAVGWGASGPVGHQGSPGPIGLSMSDMKMQEYNSIKTHGFDVMSPSDERFIHSLVDSIQRGMDTSRAERILNDNNIRFTPAVHKMFIRAEEEYRITTGLRHPSDKSDVELKYEASQIQDEMADVQKISRLKDSLEKLKSKLGFL